MHVLVTGAAGFIGSHVAEALLAAGHATSGVDDLNAYYDPALKRENLDRLRALGLRAHVLDLASADLAPCLEGVEAIVHLAAQPGISASTSFERYLANNVVATHRLVEAARRTRGVSMLVHGSTSSVYGRVATRGEDAVPEPISAYGVTKLCAEQVVLAAARSGDLPACALRLYSVYGPRERPDKALPRLLRAAVLGTEFELHEGSEAHTRSFTFVADAVAGILAALERRAGLSGEIVNVGSDAETSMERVLATVERVAGRPLRIRRVRPRPGDQSHTRADIGKARRLLGYDPRVSLDEGIARTHAWVVERIARGRS